MSEENITRNGSCAASQSEGKEKASWPFRLEAFSHGLKKGRLPTLPLDAVPSAWTGLTSLFGMGRGGTPSP